MSMLVHHFGLKSLSIYIYICNWMDCHEILYFFVLFWHCPAQDESLRLLDDNIRKTMMNLFCLNSVFLTSSFHLLLYAMKLGSSCKLQHQEQNVHKPQFFSIFKPWQISPCSSREDESYHHQISSRSYRLTARQLITSARQQAGKPWTLIRLFDVAHVPS